MFRLSRAFADDDLMRRTNLLSPSLGRTPCTPSYNSEYIIMAIINDLPGIEVTVGTVKQLLPEDNDDENYRPQLDIPENRRAKVVSKYIEAKTDEKFAVYIRVQDPYVMDCPGLGMFIAIDGEHVSRRIIYGHKYDPARGYHFSSGRMITGVDAVTKTQSFRNFNFSRLGIGSSHAHYLRIR